MLSGDCWYAPLCPRISHTCSIRFKSRRICKPFYWGVGGPPLRNQLLVQRNARTLIDIHYENVIRNCTHKNLTWGSRTSSLYNSTLKVALVKCVEKCGQAKWYSPILQFYDFHIDAFIRIFAALLYEVSFLHMIKCL